MTLRVVPVACLTDNYAYLLVTPDAWVAVVDPSESAPIEEALRAEGLTLHEVWCTHHHPDHVGGVPGLAATRKDLVVRGSVYDSEHGRIPGQTVSHGHEARFAFGGAEVRVLEVPGHTLGAIAFVVDGYLFSGDTLFLGGCGRVFEGTMPTMAESMRRLRALPPETRVCCGHEYTEANLRFARAMEPGNAEIALALGRAESLRREGEPTVPGTLAEELATNPFLRFDLPALAGELAPDESFARLREAKNTFRA